VGRPVKRVHGFMNDIHSLTKLRAALIIDRKLDRGLVASALNHIDSLTEILAKLDEGIIEKQSA
jgi:hypothetical protein